MNEPWLLPYLPDRGRLAVDVGANVGDVARELVGRFERVECFEPHPDALRELERVEGVTAFPFAVAGIAGKVKLKLYPQSVHTSLYGDADLDTHPRGEPTGSLKVDVVTLDGLGYDAQPLDFIKIDTEGCETDVLEGAHRTLAACKPTLLVEIHSERNGLECVALLDALGYELVRIPHPHPGVHLGHHWLYAPRPGEELA